MVSVQGQTPMENNELDLSGCLVFVLVAMDLHETDSGYKQLAPRTGIYHLGQGNDATKVLVQGESSLR